MRRLVIFFLLGASACWNFEKDFNDRCANDGFSDRSACGGAATGGGEATGGGPATGGGGATEVDGGADAGRFTANCTTSGWCWQNPQPVGAPDLWATFGTSDSDVWMAGSASTLLHWDGSAWGRLPIDTPLTGFERDPAIIGSVTTSTLIVLVRNRATALVGDGGVFTSGQRMLIAGSAGDEVLYLDDRKRLQRLVQPTQFGPELNAWDEFRSLAWADDAGFVVARDSSSGRMQVVNASTGGVDFDARLDGGSETLWALFVQVDGGLAVTGGHANMFRRRAARDWEEVPLAGFANVSPEPLYATTRVDDSVWGVGALGAVVNLSTQQAVRHAAYNQPTLTSAWFSGTTLWAGGRGGATLSIDATGATDGGRPSEFRVVDLWADPVRQVAVLETDLLVSSDGGAWVRKQDFNHRWVAGFGIGATMWLLDEHGEVFTWGLQAANPVRRFLLVDGGVSQDHDRNAGFSRLADGGLVVAAQGSVASINLSDGGLAQRLADATTPHGPTHIVGVVSSGDRLFIAGNASDGGGGLYELDSGSWTQVHAATDTIEGVARCPQQGTVLLAGHHEFLTSWDPASGTDNLLRASTQGSSLVFSSVWCDANDKAWVLAQNGRVAHQAGGDWVFESVGWEPRNEGDAHPTFITGTSSKVFVGGGNAAIVSRPTP